jgi:hypothetical protein
MRRELLDACPKVVRIEPTEGVVARCRLSAEETCEQTLFCCGKHCDICCGPVAG